MNNKILMAAVGLSVSSASAQGLFNIAPNDEARESKKISYTAGVNVGYDDLINPGGANRTDQSSSYISTYIGANAISVSTRQTLEFYVRYAANYHFERVEGGNNFSNNVSGGFNFTHRISERLRFSSNNHLAYQLEPDYEYGLANTRTSEEFLSWSSNNSFGYSFTERLGVYAGFGFNGVNHTSSESFANRVGYSVFVQGRYQLNPRTVLTTGYTYAISNNNSRPDSTSHIVTVGTEHRLSENSIFVARVGAQFYDVDGGSNTSGTYFEAAYRASLAARTSVRAFARYSITDYDTTFARDRFGNSTSFDQNNSLRVGVAANHTATSRLSLNAGLSYVLSDREQARVNGISRAGNGQEDEILNAYIGFSYKLNQRTNLTGSYNHTQSINASSINDYTRNRYSMGVNYTW